MEMDTYKGGRGNISEASFPIKLGSFPDTKETYAKIIEHYAAGEISENQARTLCYMMAGYLSFYRFENEQEVRSEIEAIKEILRKKGIL